MSASVTKKAEPEHREEEGEERYRMRASAAAATISATILLNNSLTLGARVLAGAVLLYQQNGQDDPSLKDLAGDLEVDTGTISRWIKELRAAHLVSTSRKGRRQSYGFLEPSVTLSHDRMIMYQSNSAPQSPRRRIHDRSIMYPPDATHDPNAMVTRKRDGATTHDRSIMCESGTASRSPTESTHDRSIMCPPVGVGGDLDSIEKDPTTPTAKRAPLKTELGRYMARKRFVAAPEFDRVDLDQEAHILAIEAMLADGLSKSLIINFLRMDPPTMEHYDHLRAAQRRPDPAPPPFLDEPPPDDAPPDLLEAPDLVAQVEPSPAAPPAQMSIDDLWNAALRDLQTQVNRGHFRDYLQRSRLVKISNGAALIGVPSAAAKAGLEASYTSLIRQLLIDLAGVELAPRFVIGGFHA